MILPIFVSEYANRFVTGATHFDYFHLALVCLVISSDYDTDKRNGSRCYAELKDATVVSM